VITYLYKRVDTAMILCEKSRILHCCRAVLRLDKRRHTVRVVAQSCVHSHMTDENGTDNGSFFDALLTIILGLPW